MFLIYRFLCMSSSWNVWYYIGDINLDNNIYLKKQKTWFSSSIYYFWFKNDLFYRQYNNYLICA